MRKERVRVKDVMGRTDENPFKRFLPPTDKRLAQMIADVQRGKLPHWTTTVRLADLDVHHTQTLASARAGLVEEPSLRGIHAELVKDMLSKRPTWIVYRAENGRLVMFDDYLPYVVAHEIGLEWVNVQILGETSPA
jgi:hypothetical protein